MQPIPFLGPGEISRMAAPWVLLKHLYHSSPKWIMAPVCRVVFSGAISFAVGFDLDSHPPNMNWFLTREDVFIYVFQ